MNKVELNQAKQHIRDLTGGSLLVAESRVVAETLLQSLSDAEWNHLFIEENILKKKSPHTAIRYARAIRRRLEPLGEAFINDVIHAPDSYYKQLSLVIKGWMVTLLGLLKLIAS